MTDDGPPGTAPAEDRLLPHGRRVGIDGLAVPFLRGRIHQVAVVPALVLGAILTVTAPSWLGRTAVLVFAASAVAMLAASAFYHCHAEAARAKLWARRVDHAMIFAAIAGTQTAYLLLTAPLGIALTVSAAAWTVAGLGMFNKLRNLHLDANTGSWLYTAMGWTSVVLAPFLIGAGAGVTSLVVAGGLVYTIGAVLLMRKWPNPWPGVVGYHELWHAMVVIGVVVHGAGIAMLTHTA